MEAKGKQEFMEFMKEVAGNGYYFPDEETMRAAHSVVSMWATEIVIIRRRLRSFWRKEILLALYEGGAEKFQGMWQIPGGYNKWPEPNIQDTCSRVAQRELGVDVEYVKTIDVYKWKNGEHPYGHPLSLFTKCHLKGKISKNVKFFLKNNLPQNLVEPHRKFIEKYL